jgi:putative Mg2+ transporter-C (MgtC) family protein
MFESLFIQLDYLLRLFIAALCGVAIGLERKNRMKEAGIRTHFIVALGSSLIMIVSKYGFKDQIGWQNLALDPSRIAAQVVTGVGFLGAGIIFMDKETIKGLTTAAGIWATAGIGLAIGSGLYLVGVVATVIVIVGQILLHCKIKWLSSPKIVIRASKDFDTPNLICMLHNNSFVKSTKF